MSGRFIGFATTLAIATFFHGSPRAQSVQRGEIAALASRPSLERPGTRALKSAYRILLRSDWPQLAGRSRSCLNGGQETVEGILSRNADGGYGGTFVRRTRLLFCGAHGAGVGSGQSCDLTLLGDGTVNVSAVIVPDDSSASGRAARLIWVPSPDHQATVTGACSPAFKQAVQEMYLGARHSVEVPLTEAGSGPTSGRLRDYPWVVSLE
jgi:hypothetical protein